MYGYGYCSHWLYYWLLINTYFVCRNVSHSIDSNRCSSDVNVFVSYHLNYIELMYSTTFSLCGKIYYTDKVWRIINHTRCKQKFLLFFFIFFIASLLMYRSALVQTQFYGVTKKLSYQSFKKLIWKKKSLLNLAKKKIEENFV